MRTQEEIILQILDETKPIEVMLNGFKDIISKLDPEDQKEAMAALNSVDEIQYTEVFLEVYKKFFTIEELEDLVKWLHTPLAKKINALMPNMMSEAAGKIMKIMKIDMQVH